MHFGFMWWGGCALHWRYPMIEFMQQRDIIGYSCQTVSACTLRPLDQTAFQYASIIGITMNYWATSSKCGEGEVFFPLHIEHQLKQELTGKKCAQTTRRLNQHNLKWCIFDAVTLVAHIWSYPGILILILQKETVWKKGWWRQVGMMSAIRLQ